MNDFDFFSVSASSSSIRSLMKLPNVRRENIESRLFYGNGKFPTRLYKVSLAFFDVMDYGHFGARKRADEFVNKLVSTKPDNVILSTKFYPVD